MLFALFNRLVVESYVAQQNYRQKKQGRRVRNRQRPGHETRVSGVKGDQLLLEKTFTSVQYIFSR